MARASDNQFPYFHLVPAAAPANPTAGERLYLDSADGNKLKRRSTTGTVTTIEGGGTSGGVKSVRASRTSGNISINSTVFVNVDTALDLTLAAVAGDVIELTPVIRAFKTASGATYVVLDFHTIVAGAPVNSVTSGSAAGTGLTPSFSFAGWGSGTLQPNANATPPPVLTGPKQYVVQAGDISGGNVTFRLRAFSGADVTLVASDPMLYVSAKNLRQ